MKKDCKYAFTLVEILVVLAIVAILVAILSGVIVQAKRHATEAVSMNNLRQCYIALDLYAENNDGWQNLPHDIVATHALDKAPTCDPLDNWRKNCHEVWGPPLVGSYAYAGYVFDTPWNSFHFPQTVLEHQTPIMADIFVSSITVEPAHGVSAAATSRIHMPDKIIFLYPDGHCKLKHWGKLLSDEYSSNGYPGLSWGAVFLAYTADVGVKVGHK